MGHSARSPTVGTARQAACNAVWTVNGPHHSGARPHHHPIYTRSAHGISPAQAARSSSAYSGGPGWPPSSTSAALYPPGWPRHRQQARSGEDWLETQDWGRQNQEPSVLGIGAPDVQSALGNGGQYVLHVDSVSAVHKGRARHRPVPCGWCLELQASTQRLPSKNWHGMAVTLYTARTWAHSYLEAAANLTGLRLAVARVLDTIVVHARAEPIAERVAQCLWQAVDGRLAGSCSVVVTGLFEAAHSHCPGSA